MKQVGRAATKVSPERSLDTKMCEQQVKSINGGVFERVSRVKAQLNTINKIVSKQQGEVEQEERRAQYLNQVVAKADTQLLDKKQAQIQAIQRAKLFKDEAFEPKMQEMVRRSKEIQEQINLKEQQKKLFKQRVIKQVEDKIEHLKDMAFQPERLRPQSLHQSPLYG